MLARWHVLFLTVLSLLTCFTSAVLGPGQLGIRWDTQQAQQLQQYVFSSIVRLAPTQPALTDEDLVSIASQAYTDAQDVYSQIGAKQRGTGHGKPGPVTVLAVGNTLYISTSLKLNGGAFAYSDKLVPDNVLRTLNQCARTLQTDSPHRTNGGCGEIMCTHMFWKANPTADPAVLAGAKIVTWGLRSINKAPPTAGIMPPCGLSRTTTTSSAPVPTGTAAAPQGKVNWGCFQFVGALGYQMSPVSSGTVPNPNFDLVPGFDVWQASLLGSCSPYPVSDAPPSVGTGSPPVRRQVSKGSSVYHKDFRYGSLQ